VDWIDVFVREDYYQLIIQNLDYCRKHKGLEICCWCIMPSHIHLIISAKENNLEIVLGKFKEFTSKKRVSLIKENPIESRREWMLAKFQNAGTKSSNVKGNQF
jgi:REP element-mobilizing transposase RayT